MNAIEIRALSKKYPVGFWKKTHRPALNSLDLTVEAGETFGFLGPNGAGKTTTLKILMGIINPSAGSASILGKDFRDPEIKTKIGFLPEQPYFYDYLSAPELLNYYAQLSGVSSAERAQRIGPILQRVGLSDVGNKQLRKFSKGMLQRVAIAQAIIHDPEVVFLDEPMSGLDPLGRREVRDIILELKSQGRTIFFSTHILSDAEMLCDRVAVLVGGKLQGVGAPRELVSMEIQGMEILFELHAGYTLPSEMAERATHTGERYRIVVPEAEVYVALEKLKICAARILSVIPLRPSLEDYFLKLVSGKKNPTQAREAMPAEVAQ